MSLSGLGRTRRILPALLVVAAVLMIPQRAVSQSNTVRFAVIGDFGEAGTALLNVSNRIKSWNPEFIVTVGDNNYPDGLASTIDANIGQYFQEFIFPYTGSYGPGGATNRFWPSIGNHDYVSSSVKFSPYLNYFALPNNERYYDLVRGPVHFIIVNSDSHEPDGIRFNSAQAAWAQQKLSASTSPWKVVVFHHTPYASGINDSGDTRLRWPFKEWGADAVFAGHKHNYEIVVVDGFPYFTNGLGGESKGSFGTPVTGSIFRYNLQYGAQRVDASADRMTVDFFRDNGTHIHSYTIDKPAPAQPTGLAAEPRNAPSVILTWEDNSSFESAFEIQRSIDGTNFTPLDTVSANATTFTDTSVADATTYHYRVRAATATAFSSFSNVAQATTPNAGRPNPPTGLTATGFSTSQINLTWMDNAIDEDGYKVERSVDGTTFAEICVLGPNASAYSDPGLPENQTFFYRVRAFNVIGDSSYSNIASGSTLANPPAAPSGLTATAITGTRIDLAWVDNASTEDGFKVERSDDGMTFAVLNTVNANVTTFSDTTVSPGRTYHYRVRSTNTGGDSEPSNTASATPPNDATFTLACTADSFVRDGTYANTNHGTLTYLFMKSTSSTGYNRDGYVKFDLSTINTVSSAKLRVFAQLDAAGSVSLGAYAVADSSWTETGITWNNRPPLGSLLSTVTVNGTTYAWYELDVTSFVQAEKVAGRNSVTIGLHLPDVVNPAVKTNSRNASGNKPELFITGS